MTAEVKVLVEGYTNADSVGGTGQERNCSTISLVIDGDIIMVVDPGVLESQQILIDALAKENVTVEDVNVVCITHSHIDHYRNIGMFPYAKTVEYYGLWDKDTVTTWAEHFTPDIQILHTPGHDYTGISLFVKTKDGVVAICGDIFWREDYPKNPKGDAYASNPDKLKESRQIVVKMADWIIPGHAGMYKNNKTNKPNGKEPAPAVKNGANTNVIKIIVRCKKCGRQMDQKDKCRCRPYLCFKCCECGLDCNLCRCSHRVK